MITVNKYEIRDEFAGESRRQIKFIRVDQLPEDEWDVSDITIDLFIRCLAPFVPKSKVFIGLEKNFGCIGKP